MRPSKRASIAAWLVVAVIAIGCAAGLWPDGQPRDGYRSELGTDR